MLHKVVLVVALGCVAESFVYQSKVSNDGTQAYATEGRGQGAVQFANGYNTGKDEKNKSQEDEGYYGSVEGGNSYYGDDETSFFDSYQGQNGKAEDSQSKMAGHNKGYSTTGFQDFHHKDEFGKKTTFYDSSDNAGGHHGYRTAEEVYGNKGSQGVFKNSQDGKYQEQAVGSGGSYGEDDNQEQKTYKNDHYDKKGYSGSDYNKEGFMYAKENKGVRRPMYQQAIKPYPGFPIEFYAKQNSGQKPLFSYY